MKCCWMLLLAAALLTVAHASPDKASSRVARAANCGCDYHSGGCVIFEPAPKGYKCVCVYRGFWSCAGWATVCNSGEHCPGDDTSAHACHIGGGDCGGYPDGGSFPGDFK